MWGVGGVVPMAAGGMGPHAFTASCSFALLSFARASGGARASDRAAGCPWGVPWGRGARVEVRRVWGIGGVVPMAAGGMGPHAFTASCYFALPSFARASRGARASDRGAGCPWGVPVQIWQDAERRGDAGGWKAATWAKSTGRLRNVPAGSLTYTEPSPMHRQQKGACQGPQTAADLGSGSWDLRHSPLQPPMLFHAWCLQTRRTNGARIPCATRPRGKCL